MLRQNNLILTTLAVCVVYARAVNLTVSSTGGNATSPLQYGVMFEDINYSGDGGIYAELIRNRAFQGSGLHPSTLTGWSSVGGTILSLENLTNPVSNSLPTSMNVAVSNGTSGQVGFKNTGWWGIDVQVQPYNGSFWVKGAYNGTFTASLRSDLSNDTFGSTQVQSSSTSSGWTQHNYTLIPTSAAQNPNNSFVLTFDGTAASGESLDFQIISLFPPTYKNRPNGMRVDLMEALAGLSPSFLRLAGGNNIEGSQAPYLWYWNQTIGPLTDRPGRPGTWGYENTDGLGLVEYMWWCQDLEMEPILAVWSGLYLNGAVIPESEIGTYVQYALDELEFLMGSINTTYGALRAYLGYPEPFVINYVEVGNEDQLNNGSATYSAYRFPAFYNAIHTAYPDITIIASTVDVSPFPSNAYGDYHEYTRPDDWVSEFGYFDSFSRDHHVLIGEYATIEPNIAAGGGPNWTAPRPKFPFWIGSVGEAVFLIGAERNSDLVLGASYAPTFQNLNAYQWTPDLISFTADPSQTVLSTSWHMISLLSGTRITETLPTTGGNFGPGYWVAGINNETSSHILKIVVYNSTGPYPVNVSFDGVEAGATANLTVLTAPDGYSHNDIGVDVVQTTTTTISASANGVFSFTLPDLSVSVLVVDPRLVSGTTRSSKRLTGPYPNEASSGDSKRTIPKGYREIRY